MLDGEIERILAMGVETRLGVRVGRDITLAELESEFDATVIAIGAQSGRALNVPGGDAPNCLTGVAFLDYRLPYLCGCVPNGVHQHGNGRTDRLPGSNNHTLIWSILTFSCHPVKIGAGSHSEVRD